MSDIHDILYEWDRRNDTDFGSDPPDEGCCGRPDEPHYHRETLDGIERVPVSDGREDDRYQQDVDDAINEGLESLGGEDRP